MLLASFPKKKSDAVLFRLLLLFIVIPFVELALLLYLADRTSWMFTLGVVVVTGIAGSFLAKSQGLRTLGRIREELHAGRMPAESMLDAVLILLAGALLLTPGLITDAFGLSLLIPPCRHWYRHRLIAWFRANFRIQTMSSSSVWSNGSSEVIDSYVMTSSVETASEFDRGSPNVKLPPS